MSGELGNEFQVHMGVYSNGGSGEAVRGQGVWQCVVSR